jgi:methyl-accepting chemotaxis protein
VTTGIVLVLFGTSEWLSYRQTSALLEQHEAILIETADHNIALAKLQETKGKMFSRITMMRILHAVLTLIAAVAALNYVWYKVIYHPIRHLLSQINIMGRGTWDSTIPVRRKDEIGELATAFNDLGVKLSATVRQIDTASRLSAYALMGNRLVRQITIARGQVVAAIAQLRRDRTTRASDPVIGTLESASTSLAGIERHFETAFERQFEKVAAEFRDSNRETPGDELSPPELNDGNIRLPKPLTATYNQEERA